MNTTGLMIRQIMNGWKLLVEDAGGGVQEFLYADMKDALKQAKTLEKTFITDYERASLLPPPLPLSEDSKKSKGGSDEDEFL